MHSRVDHFGVLVADLDAAIQQLEHGFGLKVNTTTDEPDRGLRAAFLPWGDVSIELFQVTGRPGEPGFHHLALLVDDLDEAIGVVRERGMVTVTDEPQMLGGRRAILVAPADGVGIRVQLLEEPTPRD
jgi:methylmalonyl-CoA/ethylmalonyl-CoA epimerase